MPYIKKIELRGFKSFGPKTATLMLDREFTVLTGPNGSGKTNVVDAVLFGLGELSARRLRAESFSKLIFRGSPEVQTEKTKAAKVVIQFDNNDNRIPVDTNTVTVSREVYKNGQSIYRLNGRRISRARILDLLSIAGISPTGHNFVLQGTITRMTEISSYDRRKIIADLVGIAQYDAEKTEAEEKLREAEISIRTAMGRIDEVQRRVDDLERERNDLLRYKFIQTEMKRFQAMKIYHEILQTRRKMEDLSSKFEKVRGKAQKFKELREHLMSQRREMEKEWRKLSSEVVEEGGTQVLGIQIKIGNVKSKLAELTIKIGAGTASLDGLKKVDENNLQQLEAMKKETAANRKIIRRLKREHDQLSKEIAITQSQYEAISDEAAQLRANLSKSSKKRQKVEQRLDKLYQRILTLRSEDTRRVTTIKALRRRQKNLKTRGEKFSSSFNDLEKSFEDLKAVQNEQKERIGKLQKTLESKISQRESVEKEIADASKIAESAREAVVEFATQRELAETVAAEENALRNIEELVDLGVISGVYGRLQDLVKIKKGYAQAIEGAAAGWLNSLVVKDFDTAFTCAETLKRLKLGRIKIVPLQELSEIESVNPPRVRGASGPASAFVACAKRYEPAITFVFGDTLITRDDKTAFTTSVRGYRAVTLSGDLYEAGGGMESGYYRAPINFSSIIPSESAVESLDEAVKALQEHLSRRGNDAVTFEQEIDDNRMEIARLEEAIKTLENEIARVRRSTKLIKRNMERVETQYQNIEERIGKEKTELRLHRSRRRALQKGAQRLREELALLRKRTDPLQIQEMEIQREQLGDGLIALRQRLGSVETEFSTLESKFKNVLKIGSDNIRVQRMKVRKQLSTLEKEVEEAVQQKRQLDDELLELEKSKEELSHSVLSAKEEARKFTSQIDDVDEKVHRLDSEYEKTNQLFNQLQVSLQTCQLQIEQYRGQLAEFGYEEPLTMSLEQLEVVESSLKQMRLELERIGAINQLAQTHFDEQASRYKELSLRMNELEREKQAILSFMEEIERKKRDTFMGAFSKINEKLSRFFSKLTGGGEAALKLEKPDDPLAGGVDMVVQFLKKAPILVSGASSGERSVSAVAFIFALQEFTPAAFYLFDEIDAHLDAFHVEKLGELLAEESEKSQFLVITLKPEMVGKAEKVYGVYSRSGVSNVVSAMFKGAA